MIEQPNPMAEHRVPLPITAGRSGFQPRYLKDRLAQAVVWIGGLGVIGALLLIFVYLLSEVQPLFSGASLAERARIRLPGATVQPLHLSVEEQGEVGLVVGEDATARFFDLASGEPRGEVVLATGGQPLVSVTELSAEQGELAAALADGSVLIFRHRYAITYPDDRRLITPSIDYPRGEALLPFMAETPRTLAVRSTRGRLLLAAADTRGQIHLKGLSERASLLGAATRVEGPTLVFTPPLRPDLLLMDPLLGWLYVVDREAGELALYRLASSDSTLPTLVEKVSVGSAIRAAQHLAGGISVVLAEADGEVSQWFPARRADGQSYLAQVRRFEADLSAPTVIGVEQRRRGFAVGDEAGTVTLLYATSGEVVMQQTLLQSPVRHLVFNPRAQVLLAVGEDRSLAVVDVHNEHPEVSLSALWQRVWYESYDEPRFLWQSSSASSDFEPKFSLTPLAFGTLKGAFYAMIFAIPIAILGAIFTANFMSPEMRQVVKPAVEVLAALPSVILGFLAGLWLAPFVETNLPGMFLTLLLLPLSIPLFGYLWLKLPRTLRLRVPPGWEAAILIPVIALVVWLCFALAQPIEALAFGGNMQAWMDRELGIAYDQRNALVVGIAMGIAVIPVIFSIAEDAIFSVPKHLSLGSLALGATPWQTLTGVVLPTASPGIFSAVMIGLGRAVGETMIVLMATGNTPITDFSLFSGMRTLAANVAVEMPESEVGSTHFRLLFLAGLTLFVFTFFFNTLAEVVRTRLRRKYSSL
ncbi:MAG TPA: ABC transporter permease subunit [Nevskiaceae bacterium]|nr:ABC transporter permease subunit [Nevskiaceae bacterium]